MDTTKRKFDIAYLIAKENLAFTKMAPHCELLQERHGVNLGTGYKNEKACATFVDLIAQEQQRTRAAAHYHEFANQSFILQLDGSTDVGNVEGEVFLTIYCDPHVIYSRVHVRNGFYTVRRPSRSNAAGQLACLCEAMGSMGIANWESKLIGMGCDGASVNMGTRAGLNSLYLREPCHGSQSSGA